MQLAKIQLDDALDNAGNSPTKLMRNLMMLFFTPELLDRSSAYGTGKHTQLQSDIVAASISESH